MALGLRLLALGLSRLNRARTAVSRPRAQSL